MNFVPAGILPSFRLTLIPASGLKGRRAMQAGGFDAHAVKTIVVGGAAREQERPIEHGFVGGSLRISKVEIDDPISYTQYSARHLLHATLAGRARRADRAGDRLFRDLSGAVSVTPGGRERSGRIGSSEILGLEIGFAPWFVEDACEQRLRAAWRCVFDSQDAKAFAIAGHVAGAARRRDTLACDTFLLALARHVGRDYARALQRPDDGWIHPAALARVIDRLRADPANPARLSDLAREAGLGVSAFLRAFRGSTGKTPATFAMELRVEHAAGLLRTTDLSIGEIAGASGFASASHLIRVFRGRHGHTPARWRREDAPGLDPHTEMSPDPRKHAR
jgi:AraC-like DNA-binding protein